MKLSGKSKTLLLVDDSESNLTLLSEILAAQGYSIQLACGGQAAVDLATTTPPDLIMLDIMMPGMDGYTVCRQLKADPRTYEIPVIFLSALSQTFDKVEAFAVGGVDYVTKPFQTQEVLARVHTHLSLSAMQQQLKLQNQQLAQANRQIQELNARLDQLLRQFASQEVAENLLREGFALGGHYVNATALFADIRAFTDITAAYPPHQVIELLNEFYAHLIQPINSEGGIVNQIVGDGMMCIFGAPEPQADHAERAARAAQQMHHQLIAFNIEQRQKNRPNLRIGIGIATGEVIAGYVGTHARTTYTCVGMATNLAARLETHTKQIGKPILLDENTRRALGAAFTVEDLGTTDFQGKANPVQIYALAV